MLEGIPVIGQFIIAAIIIIFIISMVANIRNIGNEEYDLAFFKSWQFAILSFGALSFYFSFFAIIAQDIVTEDAITDVEMMQYIYWGAGTTIASFCIALFLNIKQSTFQFGVVYTIAQGVVSAFSMFLVFLIFLRIFKAVDGALAN